jgi:AcrR family transcriptional regulator
MLTRSPTTVKACPPNKPDAVSRVKWHAVAERRTTTSRRRASTDAGRSGRRQKGDVPAVLQDVDSAEGTYERILAAAIKVLKDEGVVGISTRRVAQEAGANQALVHYYFRSINNLMAKVVERIGQGVVQQYEGRYTSERSFLELWREDIDKIRFSDSALTKVWFEAVAVVLNASEDVEQYLLKQRHQARAIVREAVARELSEVPGVTDVQRDADAIAVLLSLVRTGLQIDVLLDNVEGHNRALELLSSLLSQRLEPSAPPAPPRRRTSTRR